MKKEVYSCLKVLEALEVGVKNMWVNDLLSSVSSLQQQYSEICNFLKGHLSTEEFKMIQRIDPVDFSRYDSFYLDDAKRALLQKMVVALSMTIEYLRSLDMDLNKELVKERIEIERQREELESKTKQVESLQRTFEILINTLSNKKEGIPELIRSRMIEQIKDSHRGIEKNTNPDTKSQNNVLIEDSFKEETIK